MVEMIGYLRYTREARDLRKLLWFLSKEALESIERSEVAAWLLGFPIGYQSNPEEGCWF